MTAAPPSRRLVTAAFVTLLAELTGRPIGNNQAPDADPATGFPERPYAIVYALPGGPLAGTGMADIPTDATWPYQVTSIGDTPEQAEWMADFVRSIVFSVTDRITPAPAVDGTRTLVIGRESRMLGEPSWEGRLVNVAEQFALGVTTT